MMRAVFGGCRTRRVALRAAWRLQASSRTASRFSLRQINTRRTPTTDWWAGAGERERRLTGLFRSNLAKLGSTGVTGGCEPRRGLPGDFPATARHPALASGELIAKNEESQEVRTNILLFALQRLIRLHHPSTAAPSAPSHPRQPLKTIASSSPPACADYISQRATTSSRTSRTPVLPVKKSRGSFATPSPVDGSPERPQSPAAAPKNQSHQALRRV